MPKTLDAARVVNTLDVTQATGVAMSVDAQNNVHCTGWLTAEEIQTVRKVISGDIVVDKDGDVRDGHASRIAYTDTGNVLGTPTAPVNNIQAAIEAIAAHRGGSGGASALTVADTATAKALNGVTLEQKLASLYATGETPKKGDLIFVGLDRTGVDNEYAGIMVFDGNRWQLLIRTSDSRSEPFNANAAYKRGDFVIQPFSNGSSVQTLWVALKDVPKGAWNWNDKEGAGGNDYWRPLGNEVIPNRAILLVPNAPARLALQENRDIENGSIVIQQDTLRAWKFTDSSITDTPPAVGMGFGTNVPSSTNPLTRFILTFTGLPASSDTSYNLLLIVYDERSGDALRDYLDFDISQGEDINDVLLSLNAIAYPNVSFSLGTAPDTINVILATGFKALEVYAEGWSAPDPTVPLSERNWHPLLNYIVEDTFADIEQLANDGHVREGMLAHVIETGSIYIYSYGGWKEVIVENTRPHILSGLRYDPENPPHDRLEWHDARAEMAVVETAADLNNRARLPISHLIAGKLVFVRSEGVLYEFNADPTTITNTQADWKLLASGVTYVARGGNLPNSATAPLVNGQMYVVRGDVAGQPLYRLAVYDDSMPGIPAVPAVPAHDVQAATQKTAISSSAELTAFLRDPNLQAGDWASVGSTFVPANTQTAADGVTLQGTATVMWLGSELSIVQPILVGAASTVAAGPPNAPSYGAIATFSGAPNLDYFEAAHSAPNVGEYYACTGGAFTFPATAPQYPHMGNLAGATVDLNDFLVYTGTGNWEIIRAGSADHATLVAGGTVTFAGTLNPAPTPPQTVNVPGTLGAPAIPGGWRYLNRHVWSKNLRSNFDQQTDQKDGDWMVTREVDHQEIKLWNDQSNQWDTIYSRDQINGAIAAMSLFEGTVTNSGHPAPGAIEFQQLPNLRHMTAAGDLSKVSHYYTYVGSSSYSVFSSAAEKASEIAQGHHWRDITVVGGSVTHPTAGQMLPISFLVDGNTTDTVGVKRWVTVEFEVTTTNGQEKNVVVVEVERGDVAADVATKLDAAWVDGTLGLNSAVAGGVWQLTPTDPVVHVTRVTIHDGGTPIIGEDLTGAVLNPGDWVMVSNAGGTGTGTGAGAAAPNLRWVMVGGDLLAKSRADRLFGMQNWAAGSWERDSVVLFNGDFYRASRGISGVDPSPVPPPTTVSLAAVPGAAVGALTGATAGPLDGSTHTAGDWWEATGPGTLAGTTEAFAGDHFVQGDRYLWLGDAQLTGTTSDGFPVNHGFVKYPAAVVATQFPAAGATITIPGSAATPWTRLNISGGLKVATDDSQLPNTAPGGQVWIVLSSARAGGHQALYGYDTGASTWQELGGGGQPLSLTGGTIVYPNVIYHNGEAPANLADQSVIQPRIVGDLLVSRNQNGDPLVTATSLDGSTWKALHPQRLTFDADGASKVVRADHPLQFNVGIAGGQAHITHVADRSRNWVPIAQPVAPTVPVIAEDMDGPRANNSEWRRINSHITGAGFVRQGQNSKMYLGIYASQDNNRTFALSAKQSLRVGGGFYIYSLYRTATVSGNVVWFEVTWDTSNNRMTSGLPFSFDIKTSLIGNRLGITLDVDYYRTQGQEGSHLNVHGFVISNPETVIHPTLVAFAGDTNAVDVVTHSGLLTTW